MKKLRVSIAALVMVGIAAAVQAQTSIQEGFENVSTLTSRGWLISNVSSPVGPTGWFQGDSSQFRAQAGSGSSYIAANFNNALPGGTINDWLISPSFSVAQGGTVSFWTRADVAEGFGDTLRFGFSNGSASFASFALGAAQTISDTWTRYSFTFAAQPGASARFALLYSGAADVSNYVGIDSFSVTPVPEPETWALMLLGISSLGLIARRRRAGR